MCDHELDIDIELLLQKLIDRARRDLVNYSLKLVRHRELKNMDIYNFSTCLCFLFDDNYEIQWGDMRVKMYDILQTLRLDMDYMRKMWKEDLKIALELEYERTYNKKAVANVDSFLKTLEEENITFYCLKGDCKKHV